MPFDASAIVSWWWSAWKRSTERRAKGLAQRLGGAPLLISDEHDMYEMVGVLRASQIVLSSRYHAIVCSMPACVPSRWRDDGRADPQPDGRPHNASSGP